VSDDTVEPRVFVVDDDVEMREALSSLIASVGVRVECFASPSEFLRRPACPGPACLVLDVRMQGSSGLELQRQLRRAERHTPIIFITGHGDVPMAVRAMKAGAVDFLIKPFRDQELLDAIRQALDRGAADDVRHTEIMEMRAKYEQLTSRHREIVGQIVSGKLNREIARELGLSENTIKAHRRQIMKKLGVSSLAKLVQMIERLG
jgi:FixJ family two-component response regulator